MCAGWSLPRLSIYAARAFFAFASNIISRLTNSTEIPNEGRSPQLVGSTLTCFKCMWYILFNIQPCGIFSQLSFFFSFFSSTLSEVLGTLARCTRWIIWIPRTKYPVGDKKDKEKNQSGCSFSWFVGKFLRHLYIRVYFWNKETRKKIKSSRWFRKL